MLGRLVKSGNADAMTLAIELAKTGGRNDRYEAMRVLGDAGTPKAFDALLDIASTSRGQARVTALETLAQTHPSDPAVGQLLSDALFSGRREESAYAATVMGRLGTEDARQALVVALTGKDEQLAAAAAGALGQMGMTDTVKTALLGAARDNPHVKMQVMNQLVALGAPEGLRLAEEMLSGKDTSGASQAVWALASNGTADAKRLLERALDSKEPSVRMAAISSMANSPDERSTELLLRLSRDADPGVRSQALSTLGQIGGERAQAAIIDATRSGKTEDRVAAISSLASMDDAKASQQLASLLRDRDPDVVRAAIGSSYNAGPEVDSALTQMLDDPAVKDDLKSYAASQLRSRGVDLDERTEQIVTKLVGAADAYGGYSYGGYRGDSEIYY